MYKAEYSIQIFTIAGVRRPINWSSFIAKSLYNTFSFSVIIIFNSFNISLCTYLILHSLNEVDEFAESLCWFLSASVIFAKMINILLQQKEILKLVNIFNEDCLQTSDTREEVMQGKCDHTARLVFGPFFSGKG